MVRFGGKRKGLSWLEELLAATRDPFVHKAFAGFVVVVLLWLWSAQTKAAQRSEEMEDLHQMLLDHAGHNLNNPVERCVDSDEYHKKRPVACTCGDPLRPTSRAEGSWAVQHRRFVADARYMPLNRDLDVVLLGDSITERWNGTRSMGEVRMPLEYRAIFEEHFDVAASNQKAELEGLALGSSGDTAPELLWHLQNGVLDKLLHPRVWMILIGTNDLHRLGCSKRTVLAGILNVAQYLHERRPDSSIIIHGLLPRSDNFKANPVDYSLGEYWKDIMWINRELKFFCSVHAGKWTYLDASRIFLQKKPQRVGAADTKGELEIKSEFMEDALHPTAEGMDKWAPLIVEKVKAVLRDREKAKKDPNDAAQ